MVANRAGSSDSDRGAGAVGLAYTSGRSGVSLAVAPAGPGSTGEHGHCGEARGFREAERGGSMEKEEEKNLT